jgi:hypothetical protein
VNPTQGTITTSGRSATSAAGRGMFQRPGTVGSPGRQATKRSGVRGASTTGSAVRAPRAAQRPGNGSSEGSPRIGQ